MVKVFDDFGRQLFFEKDCHVCKKRIFDLNSDEDAMVWHTDEENREIHVAEDTDWMFQIDNEMPIKLKKFDRIKVPKGTYHRVIKGTGFLIVYIFDKKGTQF